MQVFLDIRYDAKCLVRGQTPRSQLANDHSEQSNMNPDSWHRCSFVVGVVNLVLRSLKLSYYKTNVWQGTFLRVVAVGDVAKQCLATSML